MKCYISIKNYEVMRNRMTETSLINSVLYSAYFPANTVRS